MAKIGIDMLLHILSRLYAKICIKQKIKKLI